MNRVRRGDVLQLDGFECHFWNREKGMMGSFMNVPSSVCLSVGRSAYDCFFTSSVRSLTNLETTVYTPAWLTEAYLKE